MRHSHDKGGNKSFFLMIIIVAIYLAFFGFNVGDAYNYTRDQILNIFSGN